MTRYGVNFSSTGGKIHFAQIGNNIAVTGTGGCEIGWGYPDVTSYGDTETFYNYLSTSTWVTPPSGSYQASANLLVVNTDINYPHPGYAGETVQGYGSMREYVALGDSFSSGKGVAPFMAGTDVDDTNECHRSTLSYAKKLDSDVVTNLDLGSDFVACSGATTDNVRSVGQWNESAQLAALSSSTDVVTVTIGGNDMGFTAFATACVLANCDEHSGAYSTAVTNINNLEDNLESTYLEILGELSLDAELYVLDYPMMVPMDKSAIDPVDLDCHYLWNGTTFSGENINRWGNARAVQDVIARLNAEIESVVYDIAQNDSRIHFVDISADFSGHDLCSSDPYFTNNYLLEGVFHPTAEGHAVIKKAIKYALIN